MLQVVIPSRTAPQGPTYAHTITSASHAVHLAPRRPKLPHCPPHLVCPQPLAVRRRVAYTMAHTKSAHQPGLSPALLAAA